MFTATLMYKSPGCRFILTSPVCRRTRAEPQHGLAMFALGSARADLQKTRVCNELGQMPAYSAV
jgi:hypothetical protein